MFRRLTSTAATDFFVFFDFLYWFLPYFLGSQTTKAHRHPPALAELDAKRQKVTHASHETATAAN
jgi:hypothetical protein|tara:strand:+ start:2279 stop:2473 length:195 start_codon:yes stop_codon:yes gene_type:complete